MKLYSGPLSLFTSKVRIALDEKRLDYECVEVGWSLEHRYLPHHPDVVALNPKRQVPVLVDGDVVVYDSTLIFEYLEERYPEPPLFPAEIDERVRCRRLEASADEILFPHIWDLVEESMYPAPASGRDAERLGRAKAGLAALYAELDKEIAGREYLCGRFSVADIATFVMVSAASTLGAAPTQGQTELQGWLARMLARPAVGREVDAMRSYLQAKLSPAASRSAQE